VNLSVSHDLGPAGSSVAADVTEPLAAVGEIGHVLPVQIARFGDLAGRDLSARAFAAQRERDGDDPRHHGDDRDFQPLSRAEQLEMRALRVALVSGYQPAVPAGGPGGPGSPQSLLRLARLRRPSPPPGPRRAAARHRRPAVTDPG
jgi:hypothetical protein